MTGFIKKLFRSKPAVDETVEVKPEPKPTPNPKPAPRPSAPAQNGSAYFLDNDSAKTFGNLEYMRSSKSVRRTFSKKKIGEDNASIRTISAMEASKGAIAPANLGNTTISQTNSAAGTEKVTERRKADSSMDMFRNMAREIKKG